MHQDLQEAIEFHNAIIDEGSKALVGYDTAKALANVVLLSEIPTTYDKREQRQVNAGNLVTKVIYLPFPQFQDLVAVAGGAEEVVSSRLEPGVNPVDEANRRGTSVETVAQAVLAEGLSPVVPPAPPGERERAIAALRAAGLLTELSPAMKKLAAESTATLEEVQALLDKAGGPPLSELILEMRGPKE